MAENNTKDEVIEIADLRCEIDNIDSELIDLFQRRLKVAEGIAKYKEVKGLPVYDPARERAKLKEVETISEDGYNKEVEALYSYIFDVSKVHQKKSMGNNTALIKEIKKAIENTNQLFPQKAHVACQGVEGSYSMMACDKIFERSDISYFRNFEGVFNSIEMGLCDYGVLPLENSTAGSVNKVYDLMMEHNFKIVKATRLKINHKLLVKGNVKLEDVKEIYSHEQAINQCHDFIEKLGIKATIVENTAAAAKMVAESDRKDVAAISSAMCSEIYDLKIIESDVADNGNNYTKFICISKNLEIYPGANRTSLMLILPHKPGALYHILSKFFVLNINLVKLESRPIPNRDFEFMFYFDIDTQVYSEEFVQLLASLEEFSEEVSYLGSYLEII